MLSYPLYRANIVCTCGHRRGKHYQSVATPQAPCRECECRVFAEEERCPCGHGLSQHKNGRCHNACSGCKTEAA